MIYLDFYDIQVSIKVNDRWLEDFIKKYYQIFLVSQRKKVDIHIDLEKYSYFWNSESFDIDTKQYTTYWDGVKIHKNQKKYYFSHQEVSSIVDFWGDKIHVKWKLTPHRLRHLVHIWLQGTKRIEKYYNRFLVKSCIHDILFILMEKKYKTALLHATAVTNGEKTFVFTWLWWSWKSTLASTFLEKKWYSILSDNYVFLHKNTLYPFPELPRITKGTQKLLNIKLNKKADGIKNYLDNNLENIKKTYQVNAVFICWYGDQFLLEKIEDSHTIFELLYSINNYTKEFPEYLNLALLTLIFQFNTNKQRIKSLQEIADNNSVYLLKNTKSLDENITKIINV